MIQSFYQTTTKLGHTQGVPVPIITSPKIVQDALDEFLAPLLANPPQQKHLAHYLTGLMISENKTISGLTNEMPNASDQSCLNRFLTEVDWNHEAVNNARIDWLQQFDDTKFTSEVSLPSTMCFSRRAAS